MKKLTRALALQLALCFPVLADGVMNTDPTPAPPPQQTAQTSSASATPVDVETVVTELITAVSALP